MKAVKLNKIQWYLNDLTDEEKAVAIAKLPVVMGFKVKNEFNVVQKVPTLLKKKYGYDIDTFSFVECRIAETIVELLNICAPKDEQNKDKDVFTRSGKLSTFGNKCFNNLKSNVKWRIHLEEIKTPDTDMPVILDEVMLGIENLTGMDWEKDDLNEIIGKIIKKIRDGYDNKDFDSDYDDELFNMD